MFSKCCWWALLQKERKERMLKNKKVHIFGSRTLKTEYPGAVSGTNFNKSFSKGTVVNSRWFLAATYFKERKGTFSSKLALGSSGLRESIKETISLFALVSPNFLTLSKVKKGFDFCFWTFVSTTSKETFLSDCSDCWLTCVTALYAYNRGSTEHG